MSPDVAAELRAKHLEMLQGVIGRMSSQSATLKNYCLVAITAVTGFSITVERPRVGLTAIILVLAFALLDARYLCIERRFRDLFDRVRREQWQDSPSFVVAVESGLGPDYWTALFSWSVLAFYVVLAVVVGLVILMAGKL